ncbi:MAG TPA: CARDB domain-containing protein, partial [Balneolales bacterium]|nr:CARDB domain-containing protein [Balneolales bacterium]
VVAYIAGNDEVKYYLLNSGTIHSTGLTDTAVMSTDGRRIAVSPEVGSIKLFDVATGKYEDTGEWPCTGGASCWIEIGGEYIAYERLENGADYRTSQGTNLEIYPPQDYNGDGLADSTCVGGWFVSPLEPRANLQATIDSITPDPDVEPIFYADEVTFSGNTGEEIIGHAWYSDLDGFLGDEPTLTTNSLSIGTHIITYEIENFERYISTSSPRAITVNSQAERVDLALEWGDISFWQDGVEVTYPSVDSPVTIKAVIHNLSTGRASSPGTVSFRDIYAVNTYRNNYLGDQILPEIPENGTASVEFTWTPDPNDPMPGYHLIEVSVAQDQHETYTSNNTASHHLVRGSGEAEGNISILIENLNVSDLQQFYVGDRRTVSGRAYYRWDESGHTYPVLGGKLTIRLDGKVYETRTTESGYFNQQVVIPLEAGFYPLNIEVSDASVVGSEQRTIEAIPYPYVGPDLTIHNIRLANGVAGMPETVHAYVVNRGGDVAVGAFDNKIEIADPSGVTVFTSTETLDNTNGLCSGCGVTIPFTGWTPSIPGNYQVTVTTDFSDSINESNENNNRVTSTFYVYPNHVDLEVVEIIKSCGTVSARIVNLGGVNSSGGLLHFSDSAGIYYTAQIPVIGGKGGSTWISATPYSGNQPGAQITACIESSEDAVQGNNCRSGIFDFTYTSDLTVSNLRMNYQSWGGANTAYIAMPNTLWAEVRNLGCMAAGGTLDFEVDGITVGNVTLPEIAGGGATVVSTTFDFLGYVAGTDYTLKGTVNAADTAPGNNSRSEALTVSPQLPDYRVVSEDITFDPEHPEKNESTVITANIHNVGLAEGNEFKVAFYEDGQALIGEIQTYSIYPGILPGDLLQVSPKDENGNLVLWQSGAPGRHTIMVTVAPLAGVENDPNDADNSATRKVIVNNDPYADVVVTGTSDTARKDDTVTFSAAGSNDDLDFDGFGGIIRYDWDFGDGQTVDDGGVEVTHQYLNGGNFIATVTVYDTNGAIASALVSVTVPYNVIGAAGPNGSISPSGSLFVNPGGVQTFTITPDIGYQILSVDGCGGTLTGNTYETGVINADCTVSATFEDNQPPTITATIDSQANASGWHNSDVTVTFTCEDFESGITDCTPPVVVSTDGAGQTVTGTAVDNAGNTASATVVLNIDKTPPVITIIGVQDGDTYDLGLVPQADYTAIDALSGLTSSAASLTGGDGLGLGTFTYSVTATDVAGNSDTLTVIYEVVGSVQGLDAQVQQYVASGDIDPALQSDLLAALSDAQQDIDAGDPDKADQDLDRLKADIDKEKDKGNITAEVAAVLINAVDYVISNN